MDLLLSILQQIILKARLLSAINSAILSILQQIICNTTVRRPDNSVVPLSILQQIISFIKCLAVLIKLTFNSIVDHLVYNDIDDALVSFFTFNSIVDQCCEAVIPELQELRLNFQFYSRSSNSKYILPCTIAFFTFQFYSRSSRGRCFPDASPNPHFQFYSRSSLQILFVDASFAIQSFNSIVDHRDKLNAKQNNKLNIKSFNSIVDHLIKNRYNDGLLHLSWFPFQFYSRSSCSYGTKYDRLYQSAFQFYSRSSEKISTLC